MSQWINRHGFGVVLYDFAAAGQFQISLKQGERVEVFKESSGWFKGQVVDRPDAKGIFPVSFVKLEENPPNQSLSPQPPPLPQLQAQVVQAQPQSVQPQSQSQAPYQQQVQQTLQQQPVQSQSIQSQQATQSQTQYLQQQSVTASQSQSPGGPGGEYDSQQTAAEQVTPLQAQAQAQPQAQPQAQQAQPQAQVQAQAQEEKASVDEPKAQDDQQSEVTPGGDQQSGDSPKESKVESLLKSDMPSDALVTEIVHCMKEWSQSCHNALQSGSNQDFHHIKERIAHLLRMRHEFMDMRTSEDRKKELRSEIIQLIEQSRKMQEGYMVVRNQDGHVADTSNTGVIELLELHRDMYNNLKEESKALLAKGKPKPKDGSTDSFGDQENMKGHFQLFLDVKMCIFAVGEDTELFFTLWNDAQKKFVTEDYMLRITAAGMPVNLKILNKMMTIFKDLEPKDFVGGLYLVCRIYRSGRLVQDPKKKKPPPNLYRRPFGAAAFNLTICGLDKQLGKVLTPPNSAMTIYTPVIEGQFPKLHEMIIQKDMKNILLAPKAKGIALGLTLYQGSLESVRKADDKLNPEDVPPTNKLDFPEVLNPGELRNDFYVVLIGGHFLQDKKKSAKNIEIVVKVIMENGQQIENCILRGTGDSQALSEYHSSVYYHSNSPGYSECIRLNIDPDVFERCHLLVYYYHVSTSAKKTALFAFSYLKLTTPSGAVVPNLEHKIPTYKPHPKMEEKGLQGIGAYYLKGDDANPKLAPRKETFGVYTALCSTKKTQNDTLHSLFKWKEIKETARLKQHLDKFTSINKGLILTELAKFVRETFDVFFGILASKEHMSCFQSVFAAILHTLALLTDKKLLRYRPLVDAYIQDVFKDPNIHQTLLNLCGDRLEEAKSNPDQSFMRMTKCLNYVFKFVVASRQLDLQAASPSCDTESFKRKLNQVLETLNDLMRKVPEGKEEKKRMAYLLPSQSYIVRNFPDLVSDLEGVFKPEELARVAGRLIEAIPAVAKQNVDKLNLVRNLLDGQIGQHRESRALVVPVILTTLRTHLREIDTGSLTEPYLCVAILQKMLTIMQKKENVGETKMWDFHNLLEDVTHTVRVIQKNNAGEVVLQQPTATVLTTTRVDLVVDPVTVLWTIVFSMTGEEIKRVVDDLMTLEGAERSRLYTWLENILLTCKYSLTVNIYPDLWIVMNFLQQYVIGKTLDILGEPCRLLISSKGATEEGAIKTGFIYLESALCMLMHEYLQLDKFSKQKQDFILKRYGDLREPIILQIRKTWESLGSHRLGLVDLVGRLFDLQQNFSGRSKELGQDMYFDLVCTEFEEKKNFDTVERFTVDALYNIANVSNEQGSAFVTEFTEMMTKKFAEKEGITERGMGFLKHINRMYVLMSSLLRLPPTALYEDERTTVALKILNYLDSSRHVRKDMYTQYTQNLIDLHESLGNYAEAGIAQYGQINMLSWGDEVLSGLGKYPSERERERKERCYKSAMEFFLAGEEYERAIDMCEELRAYYQHQIYDYEKLSQILLQESQFYMKIIEAERFYSNYFRVVYHGEGFDEEIREKELVYRGVRLEPVMDFVARIKKKYPEAKILMSSEKPNDEQRAQNNKIISVTTLTRPSYQERCKLMTEWDHKNNRQREKWSKENDSLRKDPDRDRKMPPVIRKHRDNSDIQVFTYSVPVQKGGKKPKNEFKDLWVCKTYIFPIDSFPNNRRRIEVVDRVEVMISPIENAIVSITEKNLEIKEKVMQTKNTPEDINVDLNPLTMALNGTLDAAVNGGAQMYFEAFLYDDFLKENPSQSHFQKQLMQALRDQLTILRDGMEVFGRRCGESLQGLFEHLKKQHGLMVDKTKEYLG